MPLERRRQLSLFPEAERVGPAEPALGSARLRARLPSRLRLGTSSWSFPGWAGIVWHRVHSEERLARDGLPAYASHPLLRTVGLDRTFYAPLSSHAFAAYAAQVPDEFRFVVKAHEACTLALFPQGARGGGAPGAANPRFLDAAYASEAVVAPFVEGLGAKGAALVFQFPPQDAGGLGGPDAFAERLYRFLAALPPGPAYAVEIRTASWLTPRYAHALADAGAVHCLTVHPAMPDLPTQVRVAAPALGGLCVVRWMLRAGASYEAARQRYRPFDQILDEDAATRSDVAAVCLAAGERRIATYVVANNKAEGCAPLTLLRLAEEIAASRAASRA
ncbi:MAG TPA: DUF72 domain-containing protein [Myxococcota bacterium]|nr:DUF72 domain-containing protein [Myxococcota bacterium]